MAIPISGRVSIDQIRAELLNTLGGFSLSKAGRPTTGVPGTGQNPLYTPVNQSSSSIPNNSEPYAISEWRRYNHSENLPCYSDSEIYFYYGEEGRVGELWKYDFPSNSITQLEENFGGTRANADISITRSKLWFANVTGSGAINTQQLEEYDIGIIPWSSSINRTITTASPNDMALVLGGIVAKSNTVIVGYPHPYVFSATNSVYEANINTNTPVINKLFDASGVSSIKGEIYYNPASNTYTFPYQKSDSNYAVGEFSTSGTKLNEVVTGSLLIDGLFKYNGSLYGVKDGSYNDIYELNLSSNSYTYVKTAPEVVDFTSGDPGFTWSLYVQGVAQLFPEESFTSPSLGKFYTYYRVALRGDVGYQTTIEVSGSDTNDHWCYIYVDYYPFNFVGAIPNTNLAWTYSYFSSSETKYFVRNMLATSEILHFVLYQDGS